MNVTLGIKFKDINGKVLTIVARDGGKITLEADTFITALPLKPNVELENKVKGEAEKVYFIGDAKEPRLIADAIASGAIVADSI